MDANIVTEAWIKTNSNPQVSKLVEGAVPFLESIGVASDEFAQAAAKGNKVGFVYNSLVGCQERFAGSHNSGDLNNAEVAGFWRNMIESALAKSASPGQS